MSYTELCFELLATVSLSYVNLYIAIFRAPARQVWAVHLAGLGLAFGGRLAGLGLATKENIHRLHRPNKQVQALRPLQAKHSVLASVASTHRTIGREPVPHAPAIGMLYCCRKPMLPRFARQDLASPPKHN